MAENINNIPDWEWVEHCFQSGAWSELDTKTRDELSSFFTPEQYDEERAFFLTSNKALKDEADSFKTSQPKKQLRFPGRFLFPISAAAAAILFLSWWFLNQPENNQPEFAYDPRVRPEFNAPEGESTALSEINLEDQTPSTAINESLPAEKPEVNDIPSTSSPTAAKAEPMPVSTFSSDETAKREASPAPPQRPHQHDFLFNDGGGGAGMGNAFTSEGTGGPVRITERRDTLLRNDSLFLRIKRAGVKDSLRFIRLNDKNSRGN
jgi:hypothetical protein